MNPITNLIFAIAWFGLLFFAIRSIFKGWSMMRDPQPFKGYMKGEWTTEVTKRIHPEMVDVEPGEQLMGVTFEQKTECDLEEYKELQDRISKLKDELSDPWVDEEDDDDDGDIVVRT